MATRAAAARLGREPAGSAALEFALVAPMFLLLVLGTVFYALLLACTLAVTQAANEGARASVAGLSAAERASLAIAAASATVAAYAPLLAPGLASVSAAPASNNALQFQVTVSYAVPHTGWPSLVPLPLANPSATATVAIGGY